MRKSILVAIAAMFVTTATSGCGVHYGRHYRSEITENKLAVNQLELGMTHKAVSTLMGDGEVVQYKKINFVDPWNTESFKLLDDTRVLILYYLTQRTRGYLSPEEKHMTPIILENNRVVGWGWSYLHRNLDRYTISTPHEQRKRSEQSKHLELDVEN